MVYADNSSSMNLLQDSDGNISIHEMKSSTSGTKIVSNGIFNNNFSTSTDEQNTIPNRFVDITKESLNEKDIYLSLEEDELCKMVNDMVEQEHTLKNLSTSRNLSPAGLVQQNIIQEQTQLLNSYNKMIDLPKDVQHQIIIKPIQTKETLDVENTQQIHISHLPSWMSQEYTKLIRPSKDSHKVTIKKKEYINVSNHTNVSPMLSQEVMKQDISLKIDNYNKTISKPCNENNNIKENAKLFDKTDVTEDLNKKHEVTITRIRGDHKSHNKQIKRDLKDEHLENTIPCVSSSLIGSLNLKGDVNSTTYLSFHTAQSFKTDTELPKLESLSEVSMKNSNENFILHPPIPILSPGESLEAIPSTSVDDKTREQKIMIQKLQTMVPPNIYPHQGVKTFENGNVLLVAPLSANRSNDHITLIKPKALVSNINLDPSDKDEKVCEKTILEDPDVAYKNDTAFHGSMPMNTETGEQYGSSNMLLNKTEMSNDLLLYDKRADLERMEMKETMLYEDIIPGREKRKRCRNGVKKEKKWQLEEELSDAEEEKKRQNAKKAKEHREKKKDEINALKNENMQWQLKCRELETENKQLKSQVEMLKSIFPMLNVNSIPET